MTRSLIIPSLRYRDALAAIDFLCTGFGFDRHAVYADDADPTLIHHAQLQMGDSMIMLGSVRDGDNESLINWKTPFEMGGVTVCTYIIVSDVDAHCLRARNAGAVVVNEPHDNEGYPGRSYDALDPEGNVWSFGTYDPWTE